MLLGWTLDNAVKHAKGSACGQLQAGAFSNRLCRGLAGEGLCDNKQADWHVIG